MEAPANGNPPIKFSERNIRLLATMDASGNDTEPHEQMGVIVMALVLATRKLLAKHGVHDRGRRLKVIRNLVDDVDTKLRKYTGQDVVLTEELQSEIIEKLKSKPTPEA